MKTNKKNDWSYNLLVVLVLIAIWFCLGWIVRDTYNKDTDYVETYLEDTDTVTAIRGYEALQVEFMKLKCETKGGKFEEGTLGHNYSYEPKEKIFLQDTCVKNGIEYLANGYDWINREINYLK